MDAATQSLFWPSSSSIQRPPSNFLIPANVPEANPDIMPTPYPCPFVNSSTAPYPRGPVNTNAVTYSCDTAHQSVTPLYPCTPVNPNYAVPCQSNPVNSSAMPYPCAPENQNITPYPYYHAVNPNAVPYPCVPENPIAAPYPCAPRNSMNPSTVTHANQSSTPYPCGPYDPVNPIAAPYPGVPVNAITEHYSYAPPDPAPCRYPCAPVNSSTPPCDPASGTTLPYSSSFAGSDIGGTVAPASESDDPVNPIAAPYPGLKPVNGDSEVEMLIRREWQDTFSSMASPKDDDSGSCGSDASSSGTLYGACFCPNCGDVLCQKMTFSGDSEGHIATSFAACTTCRICSSTTYRMATFKTLVDRLDILFPADHVAWRRSAGAYWHHGIVADVDATRGRLEVINYNGDVVRRDGAFASVRREWVDVDLQKGNLFRLEYEPGRCFPPAEVLTRATSRLGEAKYNPFTENCEHFARWCKTGAHRSLQVEKLNQRIAGAREVLRKKQLKEKLLELGHETVNRTLKTGKRYLRKGIDTVQKRLDKHIY